MVGNLIAFIQKKNISVFALEKGLLLQPLLLCRPSGQISFADAVLWAAAHCAGSKIIYSLDKRFPADSIEIRQNIEACFKAQARDSIL